MQRTHSRMRVLVVVVGVQPQPRGSCLSALLLHQLVQALEVALLPAGTQDAASCSGGGARMVPPRQDGY